MKTIQITNIDYMCCIVIGIDKKLLKHEQKIINNCYVDASTINIPLEQLDSFKQLCIEQKNKFSKAQTNSRGNNVGLRHQDKRRILSTLNKLLKEVA